MQPGPDCPPKHVITSTKLVHFSHYLIGALKHEFEHSCCIYTLNLHFYVLYTFTNYRSFQLFFNFLQKVQLPLTL